MGAYHGRNPKRMAKYTRTKGDMGPRRVFKQGTRTMYTDSNHSARSESITAGRGPDKSATGEGTTTGGSNLLLADIIGRPGFSEADDGSSRNILVPTSSCAYLCKHNLGCLRHHAGACVWKKSMNIVLYITLRDTRCGHAHRARQVSERFGCVGVHGVRRSSEDQARV
jgi:hypothetical protein